MLCWPRPGGRLVISGIMPEQPDSAGWRILRVLRAQSDGRRSIDRSGGRFFRFTLHALRETPATGEFWVEALEGAGFRTVGHRQVLSGLGVVWGTADRSDPVRSATCNYYRL
ncbi:hypothetical protein amrb99_15080 [Actinomadura sp. RB99]|nr:hypothetical protein [Actinomadura sp. RB99]